MNNSTEINPIDATIAVLDELKRQRAEGVRYLYMEDSTLHALGNLLGEGNHGVPQSQGVVDAPVRNPEPVSSVSNLEQLAQTSANPHDLDLSLRPQLSLPAGTKDEQWNWLKDQIFACEGCKSQLNPNGKIVFGVGNLDADLFFCGEAPGAEEELAGEPFVGPAGELLDRIISAMGLSREGVYIGNVVNFRPRHQRAYGNRPPTVEEMNFCLPYLHAQLEIVQPKVIVALGKTATDGLLGPDPKRRLGQLRGAWHEYEGIPMMVTYHPSYLLHNPSKSSKRKVWEDMLLVMEKLQLSISEKQREFFQ